MKSGRDLVQFCDVLSVAGSAEPVAAPDRTVIPAPDGDAARLLDHLGYDPCGVDELCARSGLRADAVAAALLQLELDGLVENLPGGRYQRTR